MGMEREMLPVCSRHVHWRDWAMHGEMWVRAGFRSMIMAPCSLRLAGEGVGELAEVEVGAQMLSCRSSNTQTKRFA